MNLRVACVALVALWCFSGQAGAVEEREQQHLRAAQHPLQPQAQEHTLESLKGMRFPQDDETSDPDEDDVEDVAVDPIEVSQSSLSLTGADVDALTDDQVAALIEDADEAFLAGVAARHQVHKKINKVESNGQNSVTPAQVRAYLKSVVVPYNNLIAALFRHKDEILSANSDKIAGLSWGNAKNAEEFSAASLVVQIGLLPGVKSSDIVLPTEFKQKVEYWDFTPMKTLKDERPPDAPPQVAQGGSAPVNNDNNNKKFNGIKMATGGVSSNNILAQGGSQIVAQALLEVESAAAAESTAVNGAFLPHLGGTLGYRLYPQVGAACPAAGVDTGFRTVGSMGFFISSNNGRHYVVSNAHVLRRQNDGGVRYSVRWQYYALGQQNCENFPIPAANYQTAPGNIISFGATRSYTAQHYDVAIRRIVPGAYAHTPYRCSVPNHRMIVMPQNAASPGIPNANYNQPPHNGYTVGQNAVFNNLAWSVISGRTVKKAGARTGITEGRIMGAGWRVIHNALGINNYHFLIEPRAAFRPLLSLPGDSGSGIVTRNSNLLIGMLEGGGPYLNTDYTYAIPIDRVVAAATALILHEGGTAPVTVCAP